MTSQIDTDAWYKKNLGLTKAEITEQVEGSLLMSLPGRGAAMIAMSMLSDAQELVASGQAERARQLMNQAKWVISQYWLEPAPRDTTVPPQRPGG